MTTCIKLKEEVREWKRKFKSLERHPQPRDVPWWGPRTRPPHCHSPVAPSPCSSRRHRSSLRTWGPLWPQTRSCLRRPRALAAGFRAPVCQHHEKHVSKTNTLRHFQHNSLSRKGVVASWKHTKRYTGTCEELTASPRRENCSALERLEVGLCVKNREWVWTKYLVLG